MDIDLSMVFNVSLSQCCNIQMIKTMELGRFVEMKCAKCGDLVYRKQYSKYFPNQPRDTF